MIRLAMLGAGSIAHSHAQAARSLAGCKLVAVVNHRPHSMARFADAYAVPRQYLSLDTLIAEGGIDAVIVGTPNALHAEQAIAALNAGMHVLLEKPMAMNATEARAILAASESSSALLQVAHCLRFIPDLAALRDRIAAGAIGDIVRTHGYGLHARWGPSGWFTQRTLAGGGALADMGVHAIDAASFVLGDPWPRSVFARVGSYYGDYDVDDTGLIVIGWANDVFSTVEFGWRQPHTDGVVGSTHFYGREGYARLFPTRLRQSETQRDQAALPAANIADLDTVFAAMYRSQLLHFMDCIRTGSQPVPGAREGYTIMRIVDAAYESSRRGQVIYLGDPP